MALINAPWVCAVAEVGGSDGIAWQLFASLLPPSQVPRDVNAQCNTPDLLVDEAFLGWQPADSSHLTSQPGKSGRYLKKGWSSGSQSTFSTFLKLSLSGSRRPLYLKGIQTMPLSFSPAYRNCTLSPSLASWDRKPRCLGEMALKVLADQHWFAHNQLYCIGGSVSDCLPNSNSSKTEVAW